jgi:hypothetical protein
MFQSCSLLYSFKLVVDKCASVLEAHGFYFGLTQGSRDLHEFGFEVVIYFQHGRKVTPQQVPDGDGEFPRDCRHGDILAVFLHRQLPAPFVQWRGLLCHRILGGLDQQRTHVATPGIAHAFFFALGIVAGLFLAGRQSKVADQLLRSREAWMSPIMSSAKHDMANAHQSQSLTSGFQ